MGFSFALVGISARLARAPILARGAPSAKGWAESKYKRMRQRMISLRGYVTSNVGAQKKKTVPGGNRTRGLNGCQPSALPTRPHPHTGTKAPACGMKPSGGYG